MTRLLRILPFCLALTLSAAVPSPQSFFGHPIGADRTSLQWDQVVAYFQLLAKSSDRIQVSTIGKTVDGKPLIAATIAAPETLKNLDKYRRIQQRLADPRGLSDAEAEQLLPQAKSVVMITCSIHSTEVASTHTAVEFAYRLITENRPKFAAILQNTILLLVPSQNPDGIDIVTNWYRQTLGTPYEGTSPPELYQRYVGHDNNRDWYIFSQPETRAIVSQLHNVWHPQIVYDVHQQGPFASRMFVPPWMDPIDENVDPIISQLANAIGATMASDLTAAGRKGVAMNALYDFWTPARHYQSYHGGVRILSESASAKLSSPITVTPDQINKNALGYEPSVRSWNYLEPWTGGEWHLRDIVIDQSIGMESLLYHAATRREDLVRAFLTVGRHAVARQDPHAFVITADQRDPSITAKLLETLHFGQVEIEKASEPFMADGKSYPAGSYVIHLQQPYGSFAKTLLEKQKYPDLRLYPGGPPKRPYDVTAQTLPLLMGVDVATVKDRFTAQLAKVNQFALPPAIGPVLSASDTASWKKVNAAGVAGQALFRETGTGNFAVGQRPSSGEWKPAKLPRLGLYKSYMPSMDEGWTRWLLEQTGFRFQSVKNSDITAGGLRAKYDVLLFPDQAPNSIQNGYRSGAMPPEYVGGLGEKGAAALQQFVQEGGTVIFLNDSTEYALEHLDVKLKNAVKGVSNKEFYSPGSLLNANVERHPLTYGVPPQLAIWSEGSPAWEAVEGVQSIVRYPANSLLASGWLLGEKYLAGKSALVDVPLGQGHVILFGMRPQYRAQSYLTAKLLFNALLYF